MNVPHPLIVQLEDKRADMDMSMDDVSATTGLSRAALSQWKNGRSNPRVDSLELYAKAMGMELKLMATAPLPSDDEAVRCSRCIGVVMVVNHLFAEHNRSVHGSADGR